MKEKLPAYMTDPKYRQYGTEDHGFFYDAPYSIKVWRNYVRGRKIPHGIRHTILRPAFWIGLTLGFPLEHLLWEKAWPFSIVTKWLGL